MYICENCESAFDEPRRMSGSSEEYGNWQITCCPYCGHEMMDISIFEADRCPECGSLKYKDQWMCRKCRTATRGLFQQEMRKFSRHQIGYLDYLLDGTSLFTVLKDDIPEVRE